MELYGTIRAPREILFGPGQRQAVGAVAAKLGRRALIVTDARLAADADLRAMSDALARQGIESRIESGTPPDVPVDAAIDAAEAGRDFAPDLVVAVGGGSCLDMGKTVALLLTHGGRPQDYYGENKVPGPILPVLAIPTTAGTGSEVTPVAVLSDPDRQLKVGISSLHLVPQAAICDPELTMSCPPGLTAIAGADAMTHAIEAFTAVRRPLTPTLTQERVFIGKNALSDHFALNALERLWAGLETACRDGSNAEARQNVMLGAMLAGLAFGVAGTAAAHAIQYPIGALTHTAHGTGVACLMPYVMEFNRPAIEPELAALGSIFGVGAGDDPVDAVADLFSRIGIPRSLADLGLGEDRLGWVAEQSCGITRLIENNPRPIDGRAAEALVAAAFSGERAELSRLEA